MERIGRSKDDQSSGYQRICHVSQRKEHWGQNKPYEKRDVSHIKRKPVFFRGRGRHDNTGSISSLEYNHPVGGRLARRLQTHEVGATRQVVGLERLLVIPGSMGVIDEQCYTLTR